MSVYALFMLITILHAARNKCLDVRVTWERRSHKRQCLRRHFFWLHHLFFFFIIPTSSFKVTDILHSYFTISLLAKLSLLTAKAKKEKKKKKLRWPPETEAFFWLVTTTIFTFFSVLPYDTTTSRYVSLHFGLYYNS